MALPKHQAAKPRVPTVAMHRSSRRKSSNTLRDIHNEFEIVKKAGKSGTERKCNHCGVTKCRNIPTLINHINNDCDQYRKKQSNSGPYYASDGSKCNVNGSNVCGWQSRTSPSAIPSDPDHISMLQMQQLSVDQPPSKKRRLSLLDEENIISEEKTYEKGLITSYCSKSVPPMTLKERQRAHKKFAKMFAVCGVSWELLDHPLFADAVRSLRPDFVPCSSTNAKDKYLSELDEEDDNLLMNELDCKSMCIMADGSENGAKECTTHILAVGTFGSRLINIHFAKPGQRMTAATIYEAIIETKKHWKKDKKTDIFYKFYIHDNENTEKAVGKMFYENEFRGEGGCGPHGGNKLMNYIFEAILYDEIRKKCDKFIAKLNKGRIRAIVVMFIRAFRITCDLKKKERESGKTIYAMNPDLLVIAVKEKLKTYKKAVGFPDPGQTRQWQNLIEEYRFLLDNNGPLNQLLTDPEAEGFVDDELKAFIEDDDFWTLLDLQYTKLIQVTERMKGLQSKSKNLSDTFYLMNKKIPDIFKDDDEKEIYQSSCKRAFELIRSNLYYASMAVDPRFLSVYNMSNEELAEAEDYFIHILGEEKWGKCKHLLWNFRAEQGAFGHYLFTQCDEHDDKCKAVRAWKVFGRVNCCNDTSMMD